MTAAFVAKASSSTAHYNSGGPYTSTSTASFDSTGGNFVEVFVTAATDGGATLSASDNKGNTYTAGLNVVLTGDSQQCQVFRAWNATCGAGHVVTLNVSGSGENWHLVQAKAYSGVQSASDPKDVQEGRFQTAPGSATNAISSSAGGSTTSAADLIVGNMNQDADVDSTYTAGTSPSAFTIREQTSDGAASTLVGEDFLQGAAAAARATFTGNAGTGHYATIMTAYKQAASSGNTISGSIALPLLSTSSLLKAVDTIGGSVALSKPTIASSLTVGNVAHISGSVAVPLVSLASSLQLRAQISGTITLPKPILSASLLSGSGALSGRQSVSRRGRKPHLPLGFE